MYDDPPAESDAVRELESILTALEHLPGYTRDRAGRVAERQREKEVIKDRLAAFWRPLGGGGRFIAPQRPGFQRHAATIRRVSTS